MADKKGPGKKGSRKIGRNQKKCQKYKALHRREVNKTKHVLQSNGEAFARDWAAKRLTSGYLGKLLAEKEKKNENRGS